MTYIEQEAEQLENVFEGKIPWLYRDTRGNVTVGVGKMLPTLRAAMALPFQIDVPGEAASEFEIEEDWNRIMAMPFGQEYAAHFYRAATSVFLLDDAIRAELAAVLQENDAELRRDYPNYDALPDAAKIRLLDMDYNLGDCKLRTSYPHFDRAVDAGDFLQMAANCERHGIPDNRNNWTSQGFMSCLNGGLNVEAHQQNAKQT